MQVHIPASSPLMNYQPCRLCKEGWNTGDLSDTNLNGTDPGWMTSAQDSSVSLNFTGTGVYFDLAFSPAVAGGPGSGASSDVNSQWKLDVKVNGSDIPSTAKRTPMGVTQLPHGQHHIELHLQRTDPSDLPWARVRGVTGVMSFVTTDKSTNVTVDDTQWASGKIDLSPAWNMLEADHSNYISPDEFWAEQANADRFSNKSISWTHEVGANTTIHFDGSAVWVYGLSGGDAGQYEVLLDNQSQGTFDASGGPRVYNQVLYHASALSDGAHAVTLINRGGRLSFDYLESSSGLLYSPNATSLSINTSIHRTSTRAATSTSTTLATNTDTVDIVTDTAPVVLQTSSAAGAKAKDHSGVRTSTIVGASVGGIVGLILLTILGFLLWAWCARRNERRRRHAPRNEWDEDKPWYRAGLGQEKGWKFIDLPDERVGSDLGHGSGAKPQHASGSSFGSSKSQLAAPVPVLTRRSLLPFKNNLWAKEKQQSDAPIPIREFGGRPSSASPDPMLAALGGVNSPLTQLQRSMSVEPNSTPPLNVNTAAANGRHDYPGHGPNSAQNRGHDNDGDELLEFEDMPQPGSRAWYEVFGLTPGGAGDKGNKRSSRASGSGFSNIFRRSDLSGKSATTMATVMPQINTHHKYGHTHSDMTLDPRAANAHAHAVATGAQERSPRRRFFGRDNQVDSVWARF